MSSNGLSLQREVLYDGRCGASELLGNGMMADDELD